MARIQILELPMEHDGDETSTPFVFVIDQVSREEEQYFGRATTIRTLESIAARCGARGTIVAPVTLDIG